MTGSQSEAGRACGHRRLGGLWESPEGLGKGVAGDSGIFRKLLSRGRCRGAGVGTETL